MLSFLAASAAVGALFARVHPVFVVVAFTCQLALAAAALEVTRFEPFGVIVAPGFVWLGIAAELVGAAAIVRYGMAGRR